MYKQRMLTVWYGRLSSPLFEDDVVYVVDDYRNSDDVDVDVDGCIVGFVTPGAEGC